MIRRGLLCAALLLASPTLCPSSPITGALGTPVPLAEQAAVPSDTQSETKADKTKLDETPEQPDAGVSQPESTPDSTPNEPQPPTRLDCAPAARAHTLVGKYGCVAGRVSRIVYTNKGNVRLYLCPKDQCPFHATVYADDVEKVGNLLKLRGRFVAIDGDVALYHGVPEIKVTDRDQISVTAGGSHETDVAPPGTVRQERKRQIPTEKVK